MILRLKRVLSLRTVVAASAGLTFASSSFVAAVQVAGFMAGDSVWLAILTGGLLCLLSAACFSELNAALPSAAGIRLYFGRAFNEKLALTVALLYMAVLLGVIGAESYVLAGVFKEVFPGTTSLFWISLMLLLVTAMNIRGIKIAGAFQDVFTYGLVLSLMIMSLIGISKFGIEWQSLVSPGSPTGIINAVAVGVFLFVGFEWITPLAEEVIDNKVISRGMFLAIGLLSITYALFTLSMTVSVDKQVLQASSVPQILFAKAVLGEPGFVWMTILSLVASITTFNAGLISVSRFMYASAREHVLPQVFARVSARFFTPWAAICFLFVASFVISATVVLTGRYMVLINMAAAMESIVYALVGLAVIRLRSKEPELSRCYRVKGGKLVPAACFLIFSVLAVAVLSTNLLIAVYLLAGLIFCLAYVLFIVPKLKKKYARPKQTRRRPVRTETNNNN
ncbi:amino acid permease-associated region [Desulfofarcimen acetoxidans DSM 771]|uniref:Amino acid permease-associated region n=1 Tax=Desulfofarcimen acetoxidans (strain ATCC 49208 / DSM 771 / KCTC 5769 / VKM B-1644 / 5575) TaxID=485916 RepID=C8VWH6_DESAS|nr:amino acid permease-associated region [Desulfofarcimen acetoxidans DSM 771]